MAGFGACAGFSRLAARAFGIALCGLRGPKISLSKGQGIGTGAAARLGPVNRLGQLIATDRDFLGGCRGFGQGFFGLGAALGQFGAALFRRFQPVLRTLPL
jgi:hypothetical protein